MPDEDKTFGDFLVLDLRIWWRQVHTLYTTTAQVYHIYTTTGIPNSRFEESIQYLTVMEAIVDISGRDYF